MPATPKEHDIVALLVDLPQQNLQAGDTGAVIHVYQNAPAYEVEFVDVTGKSKGVVTLEGKQVLKLNWAPAAVP